jgi:eukaryotic-like serine/threonine-protein kinase
MNSLTRLFDRWTASRRADAPGVATIRPETLPVGTTLGRVRIERPIARGAMGSLYAGIDLTTGAAVAVKVMRPAAAHEGPAEQAEACARFLQEAENASRLCHPNIVRVQGSGLSLGTAFLVMELLPGADLSRYTNCARLLPEPVALNIAARLAEALAYAHRQGVVHRDVKPANVMFDPASDTLKLTDFGLARAPAADATRSGMLLGSPVYMAPELLAGARADARSDLYALAVLLFELLTGRLPFEGRSMGELLRAMATQAPQSVRAVRPDLNAAQAAALDAVLAPMLSRVAGPSASDGEAWAVALLQLRARWPSLTASLA